MSNALRKLRLGSRGSLLARSQSSLVAADLERAHPGLRVELVILKTSGDVILNKPLHEFGGKGLFTKELEQALLDREIDFAVHSFKDMPTTMPLVAQENLTVAAVPARHDPRDMLISRAARTVGALPQGGRVGTGSLRRRCQLLHLRPDLQIEPIRGNIDTRIGKLLDRTWDAVVLATSGVQRAGLFDAQTMTPIDPAVMLPAPAQGALALQCRRDDEMTQTLLAALNDPTTMQCVQAERELVALLEGDCLSPIAALGEMQADRFVFRAAVGRKGGLAPTITATAQTPLAEREDAVQRVFQALELHGARKMLHG